MEQQPNKTIVSFVPEVAYDESEFYAVALQDRAVDISARLELETPKVQEVVDWGAGHLGQAEMLDYLQESPFTMTEITAALALAKTAEQREQWQNSFGQFTERIPSIELRFEQLARLKDKQERLNTTYPEPAYGLRMVRVPYKDLYTNLMPAFNAGDTTPQRLDRPGSTIAKIYSGEVHVDEELLLALRGKITPNITGIKFLNTPIGKLAQKSNMLDDYGLMMVGKELRTRDELRDIQKITGIDCMEAGLAEGLAIAKLGGLRIGDTAGFPQYIPNSQGSFYCGVNVERLFANNSTQNNPRIYFGLWKSEGGENCLLAVAA